MDVSVVIPTFNEEKYLGKCLESIFNQDFEGKYEVIIGDSYSTDSTVKIAEDYGARVEFEKKKTISAGRNKAALSAKGKIIAFTDADSVASFNWLSEVYLTFNKRGTVGMHGLIVPYDGAFVENLFCRAAFPPYSKFLEKVKKPGAPGSNFAIKKEVFDKIGGFNIELVTGEDIDLAWRAAKEGKFRFNRKALVFVSTRRLRKWGYKKYIKYYTTATYNSYIKNKHSKAYEIIR